MKKILLKKAKLFLILLILKCFSFAEIKAQNYIPLLDTNKTWSVLTHWNFGPYHTHTISLGGDTIIDARQYKKIIGTFFLNGYLSVAAREDTTSKQVFFYAPYRNEEYLAYDFSLNQGDTFFYSACGYEDIVDYIDTITLLNGEQRRQIHFKYSEEKWIEGIGSYFGLTYVFSSYCLIDVSTELLCFEENDTVKYRHQGYNTCFYSTVGTNEKSNRLNSHIIIYPNPIKNNFSIETADDIYINQIKIYNLSGQEVYSEAISKSQTPINLTLPNLPNGMYVVNIQTEHGVMNKKINVVN
jgi:hypothetical protein